MHMQRRESVSVVAENIHESMVTLTVEQRWFSVLGGVGVGVGCVACVRGGWRPVGGCRSLGAARGLGREELSWNRGRRGENPVFALWGEKSAWRVSVTRLY